MANATKISNFFFGQWATPTAPNPRLSAPISASDPTITFTSPLLDASGAVCSKEVIIGIRRADQYVESVRIPAGGFSPDGLTATGGVRGIELEGLDYTTGDSSLAVSHLQGESVFVNVTGVYESILNAWVRGTLASGGSGLIIGTDASGTTTFSRSTGVGTSVGFLRWLTGTSKAQFSNDGTTWVNFDSVSASNLVAVSAADTTPGYLSDKLVSATGGLDFNIVNPGANETLNLALDLSEAGYTPGPLATVISNVTATAAEVNKLSGTSANVTAANLNTLTAGPASDASSLHTHNAQSLSLVAYEACSANDAVALMPIEIEYYSLLTETSLPLGSTDGTRGYAMKFVPSVTSSNLTTMLFRAAEQVNGATLGDLDISIQTDSAGSPSGTIITNGSATQIPQATLRTWNTTLATRTATWASPPTLTAGTTYWIVWKMNFTDPTNYLKLGFESSGTNYVNYISFTRKTFTFTGSTWGTTNTTQPIFCWFDTQKNLLGTAVVPCDANIPGRLWRFIGFANGAISAQATGSVYYNIVPGLTGLTSGAYYYLSATTGAITTTAPNTSFDYSNSATNPTAFTYRIGRAINTTTLQIAPGKKRVSILESSGISATTTRNFMFWFNPDVIYAGASGFDANDSSISSGFLAHGAQGQVGMAYNLAANGTAQSSGTLLNLVSDSGNALSVAVSGFTAGMQAVYTETGSITAGFIWIVAEQD